MPASSNNKISLKMILGAKTFLEESVVLDIPTVTTYPDFVQSLLEAANNASDDGDILYISRDTIDRGIAFFQQSLVLVVPTVVTYPDFIKDFLRYAANSETHEFDV